MEESFEDKDDSGLRGPRDPDLRMVKIEFYVVFDRDEPHLPNALYRIKKYCS